MSDQVVYLEKLLKRPLFNIDDYGFLYEPPSFPKKERAPNERLNDSGYRFCYRLDELGNVIALNLFSASRKDLKFVSQLPQLQSLNLSENQITDFAPLAQLPQLQSLDLSGNQITDCAPLAQLPQLQSLNLSWNQITDCAPLAQLPQLQSLDLSGNQITDFAPLAQLPQLQSLNLSGNQITDCAPLAQLPQLQSLNLSRNQITDCAPLAQLSKLRFIDLVDNQIRHLPSQILDIRIGIEEGNDYFNRSGSIYFKGNPFTSPPIEIIRQGLPSIENFFRAGETEPLREAKILVVGEAKVGKTSLIKQLLKEDFIDGEPQTYNIDRHHLPIPCGEKGEIDLHLWDFGGQDIMHATHQFFFTRRSLYLLVLDSRRNERQHNLDYWLRLIESFGGDSPVIVVCNQCDEQVMDLAWNDYQTKYPQIRDYVKEVSCFHDKQTGVDKRKGINKLQTSIKEVISNDPAMKHVGDSVPKTWFAVKKELESFTDSNQDSISRERFAEICQDCGVKEDSEETLLKFLHDLGVILHFDKDHPLLPDGSNTMEATKVLNPEWVTAAIYRILNDTDLHRAKGLLKKSELTRILNEVKNFSYNETQQDFIIEMMDRFDLSFETENRQEYLIPSILPKDKPDTGEWQNSLGFRYTYDVLPEAIISRFIVRMKDYISGKTYWRTGVVLKREGIRALIEADTSESTINIHLLETSKGQADERRRFLEIIRHEFGFIHNTFSDSQNPNRLGIKEFAENTVHPKIYQDYRQLLVKERTGKPDTWVDELAEDRPLSEFLDGVSLDRKQLHSEDHLKPRKHPEPPSPPSKELPSDDQPQQESSWNKTTLWGTLGVTGIILALIPSSWLSLKITIVIAAVVAALFFLNNPKYFWRRCFLGALASGSLIQILGFTGKLNIDNEMGKAIFEWDGTKSIATVAITIVAMILSALKDKN